MKICSVKKKCL